MFVFFRFIPPFSFKETSTGCRCFVRSFSVADWTPAGGRVSTLPPQTMKPLSFFCLSLSLSLSLCVFTWPETATREKTSQTERKNKKTEANRKRGKTQGSFSCGRSQFVDTDGRPPTFTAAKERERERETERGGPGVRLSPDCHQREERLVHVRSVAYLAHTDTLDSSSKFGLN